MRSFWLFTFIAFIAGIINWILNSALKIGILVLIVLSAMFLL